MYMFLHEHIFTSGVGLFIFALELRLGWFYVAIWLFCFAPTKKEKRHQKCVAETVFTIVPLLTLTTVSTHRGSLTSSIIKLKVNS